MADIIDINSAQTVKIVGADSSGVEQTPVQSTSNGDLQTSDVLLGPGLEGNLTIGISPVELRVGGSALANRKLATLTNTSNSTVYWGWTNAVTITTGTPIVKNQQDNWSASPTATIFLVAGSAGNIVRITESA